MLGVFCKMLEKNKKDYVFITNIASNPAKSACLHEDVTGLIFNNNSLLILA